MAFSSSRPAVKSNTLNMKTGLTQMHKHIRPACAILRVFILSTQQEVEKVIYVIHIVRTLTLVSPTVDVNEKVFALQRIIHSNVNSCILVHNEVTHRTNKREFECKQVRVGPLGLNLPVNVNVHLCMKRASGFP